jgi:hypothetical protein
VTKLLQCLRDELVRRDYAAPTIRSYVQIVEAFSPAHGRAPRSNHSGPSKGMCLLERPVRSHLNPKASALCAVAFP